MILLNHTLSNIDGNYLYGETGNKVCQQFCKSDPNCFVAEATPKGQLNFHHEIVSHKSFDNTNLNRPYIINVTSKVVERVLNEKEARVNYCR